MKTTKLVIREGKREVPSQHGTLESTSQKVFITRHEKKIVDFYDLRNLKNTHDVEVWMDKNKNLQKLHLPQKVLDAISSYIRLQSEDDNIQIDCFAFSCMAEGLSIPERRFEKDGGYRRKEMTMDRWEIDPSQDLKPGDMFFMYIRRGLDTEDPTDTFMHSAIYIGQDLYVSVYGLEGELTFSTLEDMKRDFKVTNVVKVKPRA